MTHDHDPTWPMACPWPMELQWQWHSHSMERAIAYVYDIFTIILCVLFNYFKFQISIYITFIDVYDVWCAMPHDAPRTREPAASCRGRHARSDRAVLSVTSYEYAPFKRQRRPSARWRVRRSNTGTLTKRRWHTRARKNTRTISSGRFLTGYATPCALSHRQALSGCSLTAPSLQRPTPQHPGRWPWEGEGVRSRC